MKKFIQKSLLLFFWMLGTTACWPAVPTVENPLPTPSPTSFSEFFSWPQEIYVKNTKCEYGSDDCYLDGYQHTGIDSGGSVEIKASAIGTVERIIRNDGEDHNFGNTVIIQHCVQNESQPIYTLYAHLARISEEIAEGTMVNKGDFLGIMGASGDGKSDYWDEEHLHFEFKTAPVVGDPKSAIEFPQKYPDGKYFAYITNPDFPSPNDWGYQNPNWFIDRKKAVACSPSSPITDLSAPAKDQDSLPTETPAPVAVPTTTPQPTGQWIAYIGPDENIWLVDLDGNTQQLTFDGVPGNNQWKPVIGYRNLNWSPDGRRLGALRIDESGTELIALRLSDYSILSLMSDTEGTFDWLPDSKSIIFSTIPYHDKNQSPGGLSLLNIETGQVSPFIETSPGQGLVHPDWADQGDNIYFSIQPAPVPDAIWGDTLGLANEPGPGFLEIQNSALFCDWNSNGQNLVCTIGSGEILCSNLGIFSSSGALVATLAPTSGCIRMMQPNWSPDGNWIAFKGEIGDQTGLFTIKPDGSHLTFLGHGSVLSNQTEWSPDSQLMAYLSGEPGSNDIYVQNIQTQQEVNLTNSSGDERELAWQPGSYAAVVFPTQTANPGPEQLDLTDPESIVYWLAYDLAHGITDSFSRVIMMDTLLYGTGMSLGRDPIDRQTFLYMLQERIASKPTCAGYSIGNDPNVKTIMLWTKGWRPLWDFHGQPTSEEIVFSFFLRDGQVDTWAYFTPSSAVLEIPSVDHEDCPGFDMESDLVLSSSGSSTQYAQITSQVVEVNLRMTPGYTGKNDLYDVIVRIPSGALVEIIGGPEEKDDLTWWNITWNGYTGWIADHTGSGREVMTFNP